MTVQLVAIVRVLAVLVALGSLAPAYVAAQPSSSDETSVPRTPDGRPDPHSRRGGGQFMGRDPYHRVVNVQFHANSATAALSSPEVGSILPVTIVEATPHSLIAELVS